MSRPSWSVTPLVSGQAAWDAVVNDNLTGAKAAILDGPAPLYQKSAGDESDLATVFPPASYERCVLWVNHSTLGWALYYSDGATWRLYARTSSQADSTATDVAGLKADFNALLAKLRACGVLGPPTP